MCEIDGDVKSLFAALRLCVKQLSRYKGTQRHEGAKALARNNGHAETQYIPWLRRIRSIRAIGLVAISVQNKGMVFDLKTEQISYAGLDVV